MGVGEGEMSNDAMTKFQRISSYQWPKVRLVGLRLLVAYANWGTRELRSRSREDAAPMNNGWRTICGPVAAYALKFDEFVRVAGSRFFLNTPSHSQSR
jgi:hypothetical protein